MDSVQCTISDSKNPQLWIEIEIGLDDTQNRFWRLTGKSPVSFNQLTATSGTWDYGNIVMGNGSSASQGIDVYTKDDQTDYFALSHVPRYFYMLGCGQNRSGDGFRTSDGRDVRYSMDFLCV